MSPKRILIVAALALAAVAVASRIPALRKIVLATGGLPGPGTGGVPTQLAPGF